MTLRDWVGLILAVVGAGSTLGTAIFWGAFRLGQMKSDQDRNTTRLGDHDLRFARVGDRLDQAEKRLDDHDALWRDARMRRHDD